MVLEDINEPPKKKLKQAQLPFCNQPVKNSKRKCSEILSDHKQTIKKLICQPEVDRNQEIVLLSDDNNSNDTDCQKNEGISKPSEIDTTKEIKETESYSSTNEICLVAKVKENNSDEKIDIDGSITTETFDKNEDKPTIDGDLGKIISKNANDEVMLISSDAENEENMEFDEEVNRSNTTLNFSSEDDKSEDKNPDVSPTSVKSSDTPGKRKLTPKALEKRKIRESMKQEKMQQKERLKKEKEERLKMKIEKEEQKRKEKEEKEEQKRKEKEEKEEQKRKEKEEKEEQKRKEKEEKEKKKLAELKQKEDEKRLKEEERRKKEEAKEEERKKKEEAKILEQKKADQSKKAFTNFFILKKSKAENQENAEGNGQPKFMPFPVKPDMRLAVHHRRKISEQEKNQLVSIIAGPGDSDTYLNELKSKRRVPLKGEPTWPLSVEQHDVIIIESVVDDQLEDGSTETSKKLTRNLKKAKLLQFHENRRPAYWGTWRKRSKSISPRRPLLKDDCLNYEVDSDSEWEDEGEGEDIGNEEESDKEHSDDEAEDEQDENGYILDNTFVPHGYLSDEEVHPDEENFDPEDHKLRLKVLKKEFEAEMKMKTERLKPRLLGCVWISNDITAVSKGSLYEVLMKYRAVWNEDNGPINVVGPPLEESPVSQPAKSKVLPENVMEQLVKFIHGNYLPFMVMVQEFRNLMEKENQPMLSKKAISLKIKDIARKEIDENGKPIWLVNNELCAEYGLTPLTQLNSPKIEKSRDKFLVNFLKRPSTSPQPTAAKSVPPEASAKTEFTVPNVPVALPPPSTPPVSVHPLKKRATLITLPSTPTNDENRTCGKVHKDTPRPVHPFFKGQQQKDPIRNVKKPTEDTEGAMICDEDNN